ncbi:MAG TPA: ATP-binding protein [Crocinitomicaceae bacterium]|nr:ATP-binding protein [Crocinitomicaceae bacterium]
MKKKNFYFIYFLVAYVILQYVWWTYMILKLGKETANSNTTFLMLIGEGSVFLFIIIFTFLRLITSLRKEEKLKQQKNNFLLSVTHELKTPLAHNKLSVQTLLKYKDLDEHKRTNLLTKILSENNRLEHLVENILTSTRIETKYFKLNKEKFILFDLINELIGRYAILMNETKVNIVADNADISVYADKKMIETVFINLIENFHKYAIESESLTVMITPFGNKVKCSFADCGSGIPIEYRKDVFKKFVRTENEEVRTKEGTGLGLYIAKEFLKLNNGNIVYLPNKPKGSIFEITLPRN